MADPTNRIYTCPMELAVDLLAGKWKPQVLWYLKEGVQCFGALSRHMPLVKSRKLTEILGELERDGLVERILHSEVPLSVDYVITDTGRQHVHCRHRFAVIVGAHVKRFDVFRIVHDDYGSSNVFFSQKALVLRLQIDTP